MRIKLAILENDTVYLNRIVSVFQAKYADKLEVYAFTEPDTAIRFLGAARVDVFLADAVFEIDMEEVPARCGVAYLVEDGDVKSYKGLEAVHKFMKIEMIYRQVLGIFSEKAADVTGTNLRGEADCKVLAFLTAAGGTGSSTAAAACAMNFAQKGKKVLYLNLERFGSADVFFCMEGSSSLGDIIYAVKGKKGNLALKLESAVKHDISGVFFYSSAKMALDVEELKLDEIQEIISTLRMSGNYSYIILDLDFSMDREFLILLEKCNDIIFVADGSQVSNVKLERAIESLRILEQQYDMKLLMRSGVLYNRFSSQTSQKADIAGLNEYGGIKRFEGFGTQKLLQQLKIQPVFDMLE
ncbi:MAG: chromosome partitioning protein ParA [Lachnospiraceae bacterium]|nr:chromosome partitioning protein ParA [Lachnospiraceae bacterium]